MTESEWEALARRHGSYLCSRVIGALRAAGAVPTAEQVEELVQEVYCRLLARGSDRLRQLLHGDEEGLTAYLGRVASSVVFDAVRAIAAVKRGRAVVVPLADRREVRAEWVPDPAATPEVLCLLAEGRRHLLERCRFLAGQAPCPASRRRKLRILHRALLEGWSSEEIAQAEGEGVSSTSIDTVVYRARRHLRRRGVPVPDR